MRMLGIFGTKISPPRVQAEAGEHELDALVERDPEPRHALVRDRQAVGALGDEIAEQRHHAAARADDVAVAHHREQDVGACPSRLLPATKILSEASLLAP